MSFLKCACDYDVSIFSEGFMILAEATSIFTPLLFDLGTFEALLL